MEIWDQVLAALRADAALRAALAALVGGGIGPLVKKLLDWVFARVEPPASPKDKRWVAIGACVLLPTAVYALYVLVTQNAWMLSDNLTMIGAAFLACQAYHGTQNLPSRADIMKMEPEARKRYGYR
jgi:hypothetical protein